MLGFLKRRDPVAIRYVEQLCDNFIKSGVITAERKLTISKAFESSFSEICDKVTKPS